MIHAASIATAHTAAPKACRGYGAITSDIVANEAMETTNDSEEATVIGTPRLGEMRCSVGPHTMTQHMAAAMKQTRP